MTLRSLKKLVQLFQLKMAQPALTVQVVRVGEALNKLQLDDEALLVAAAHIGFSSLPTYTARAFTSVLYTRLGLAQIMQGSIMHLLSTSMLLLLLGW